MKGFAEKLGDDDINDVDQYGDDKGKEKSFDFIVGYFQLKRINNGTRGTDIKNNAGEGVTVPDW